MTSSTNRKDTVSALLRVFSVFILDFLINIVWSLIVVVAFSIFFYNIKGQFLNSNDMIDQMIKSPEYLFTVSIYNLFVIMITFLFWKYVDKQNTQIIGLNWKKNSFKMLGLGVLGGTLEIALIILLSLGMGILWFQNVGFDIFSINEILKSLAFGILAFLLVGFGEEALFRGYIQKRLMLTLGNKWALLISSLIFMAAHILTYGKLLDFIDVALGGVILGYLYILTDSLYLPAAYHFVYDFIQVNIVKLQEYEHYKGAVLYIFNNSGDVIIKGFNLGNVIEISFILAEVIVLILIYIFRHTISENI
jgi:membrane protease YdiL (CAAX protease family)